MAINPKGSITNASCHHGSGVNHDTAMMNKHS